MTDKAEIIAVKGFNRDWTCRGFKFKVGKTYECEGEIIACENGFHAIEGNPLEVLGYYPPSASVYAIVRQSGDLARRGDDSKVASRRMTVVEELPLADLVQRAVDWAEGNAKKPTAATGDQGAASATGHQGAASATGYQGAASATGDRGAASATGYQGAASATGYKGQVMGANGCALFLVNRDIDGTIRHVWCGIAGRDGIKPHVFYTLDNDGNPQEVV